MDSSIRGVSLISPHLEESIFLRFKICAISAVCARNILKKISKPIFFTDFCEKK